MSASAPPPTYFETSWSILSSIGLCNILIGFLVIGITNISRIALVPIVVSAACAIADGLCYYAFYANHPTTQSAVAAVFADLFWLIQEAGLSFYSYQILILILGSRERRTFMILFWTMILIITVFRFAISVGRVQDILDKSSRRVPFIDHMHIGYFTSIALIEMISSYFLLRTFFSAQSSSLQANSTFGLFQYMTRSAGIRLAVLTLIGITRAITYSFQTTAQSATGASGQVDRFVTTLECIFPIVMFIDILAARSLVNENYGQYSFLQPRSPNRAHGRAGDAQEVYRMGNIETWADANVLSSSLERIVGSDSRSPGDSSFGRGPEGDRISGTVDSVLRGSESPV